jgi:hypothetical protein
MPYTLRATSLTGSKLDAELTRLGAHTSGSTQRKQQRLQRFLEAASKEEDSRQALRIVIENEQRKVYERAQARAYELRSRF